MEFQSIIDEYKRTKSILTVSKNLSISSVKVRRVLIAEGLWSSKRSLKIAELKKQGLTIKEIAEKLETSEKNVNAYLPYSRGLYNTEEKSDEAIRAKVYRERNRKFAGKQVANAQEEEIAMRRDEELIFDKNMTIKPFAIKLKLELDTSRLNSEQFGILKKYGKMKDEISREIVVPSDITLHSLHYAIQRLFGWKNCHLHDFKLPEAVFNEITQDSVKQWLRLCGVYFRFPDGNLEDRYWDDDYDESMSIDSWFKTKYQGPYQYGAMGDYYYTNQMNVKDFMNQLPEFKVLPSFEEYKKIQHNPELKQQDRIVKLEDAKFSELKNSIAFEEEPDSLLERLFITDYMKLPNNAGSYYHEDLEVQLEMLENDIDESIKMWNEVIENDYDTFCMMTKMTTTRWQPITDELIYSYNAGGENWKVKITCTDFYYSEDNAYLDSTGNEISDELYEAINDLESSYSPVCINSDGLNVMEDTEGIEGYCEFLQRLNESKDEKIKQQIKENARIMGWTGRNISPQYKL